MMKLRAISPQKRAANRANARKSSGPKSSEGRSRSSLNSVKHSLTRPIDVLPWGEHLGTLAQLLEQEGLSLGDASDLARKILDYERNVDYQRSRFLDFKAGGTSAIRDTAFGACRSRYRDASGSKQEREGQIKIKARILQ